ncbi:tRNA (adenosine(37)-N6)-dimethylallyltransferase MiaA [Fulvivirga sedimenti]|uniref:tRNA dimethylallyltransferase n=1 Tax=Fulvivirga sedimenti TaxID=2879465 RepID=A0A9X1HY43_9BACT|nr:tRNA (adenosine(37)-N6)-dimethylallyltransferase MiaA [Fulvivirga sedimenti]MCA6078867.1 tRNA (adenosine(37)-N6)-dimethylallyltransferase MiaA [Fulvivirga sedimenti]
MKKWVVITGPTASGKTKLAVQVAARLGGEVISIDSRQVYKSMNIGTGKDLNEYNLPDGSVPYHMIDIVEPGADYHLTAFQEDFTRVISDLNDRNKIPILCGGSGLYLEAVLQNHVHTTIPVNHRFREMLDKLSTKTLKDQYNSGPQLPFPVDVKSKKRLIRALEMQDFLHKNPAFKFPEFEANEHEVFIIDLPRDIRRNRITARLLDRLNGGLIEEVTGLRKKVSDETLIRYGLEYKYVVLYLQDKLSREDMSAKLTTEIHRFAKRQMTWFRRMARNDTTVHWLDGTRPLNELVDEIVRKYNN